MSRTLPSSLIATFFPTTHLALFADLIDQQLEHDFENLAMLLQAQDRASNLPPDILNHFLERYTKAIEIFLFFRKQLKRWKKESLSLRQVAEINRIEDQVLQIMKCGNRILTLVKHFQSKTTESILEKSDLERETNSHFDIFQTPS